MNASFQRDVEFQRDDDGDDDGMSRTITFEEQ